jgi:hypothetical protein
LKKGATMSDSAKQELLRSLTEVYGPLIASRFLWKVLGFPSAAAYRQARVRNTIPVKEFDIESRKGKFALTVDVVDWLLRQRNGGADEVAQEQT